MSPHPYLRLQQHLETRDKNTHSPTCKAIESPMADHSEK